jgi:hypothetical protein
VLLLLLHVVQARMTLVTPRNHSQVHSLTHSLPHSLIYTVSLPHSLIYCLTASLTHSPPTTTLHHETTCSYSLGSLPHYFTHSLTYPLTHSYTHLLTHSLSHYSSGFRRRCLQSATLPERHRPPPPQPSLTHSLTPHMHPVPGHRRVLAGTCTTRLRGIQHRNQCVLQ